MNVARDELEALERALAGPRPERLRPEREEIRRQARLEFWMAQRPADPCEHELENARRRLALGNLSGLWDALAACAAGRVGSFSSGGLTCRPWLAASLLEVAERAAKRRGPLPRVPRTCPRILATGLEAAAKRAAAEARSGAISEQVAGVVGKRIPAGLASSLCALVLLHLFSERNAQGGRHSRWWARWLCDLRDDELAGALDSLRARRDDDCSPWGSARESVEALSRLPASSQRDEQLRWQRFLLDLWSWNTDNVAAAAARSVDPCAGVRTVLEARARVRESASLEPWRYNRGTLAWLLDLERERSDRNRQHASAFRVWLLSEFESWAIRDREPPPFPQ